MSVEAEVASGPGTLAASLVGPARGASVGRLAVASRRDLIVAATVVAWVGVVLPLDAAGTVRQLWLGGVTSLLLVALLWRESATTRAQVVVVVAFATLIEYTFSAGLGVYAYRLDQ